MLRKGADGKKPKVGNVGRNGISPNERNLVSLYITASKYVEVASQTKPFLHSHTNIDTASEAKVRLHVDPDPEIGRSE